MLNNIGVVGAGAMGAGIAQLIATAGYNVVLVDINNEVLQKAKNTLSSATQCYIW